MKRVLIANRGAIAKRIIRTLDRIGIESVAVYHSDEKDNPYLDSATYTFDLGGGSIAETFLNIDRLIGVAKKFECDALHPGYGFLSENYLFAKACEENDIKFIGPSSPVIRLMGLKSKAKEVALKAKIPVLEGNPVISIENINIDQVDFPVLIKAIAGGGGKGLKIVRNSDELKSMFDSASREAEQYFGNKELMIEPYIENARHIEIQILGNDHGEVVHLFERECSIQRNHQKVIEEAPAASLSKSMREQLYSAAVRFATQLHYTGAGTVEFLVNGSRFWFLEMNTRIQVEHAVTEEITGVDIVEQQIRIARGESFSSSIKNIGWTGHAIEARIYAEDPLNNYRPSAGEVMLFEAPNACRLDTFLADNIIVTPHFDSLLGKLIVKSNNRDEAVKLLNQKITALSILGIKTNKLFLSAILSDSDYRQNNISTTFLSDHFKSLEKAYFNKNCQAKNWVAIASFLVNHFIPKNQRGNLWQRVNYASNKRSIELFVNDEKIPVGFSIMSTTDFQVTFNNHLLDVKIQKADNRSIKFLINDNPYNVHFIASESGDYELYEYDGFTFKVYCTSLLSMASQRIKQRGSQLENMPNQIISPLFGKVLKVMVNENDFVAKGDLLLTIESMKTENSILAPGDGKVHKVLVKEGLQVTESTELLTLTPIE